METTIDITTLIETLGGVIPEDLVQLLGEGAEEAPDQFDEILELRCSSL